MLKHALAATCLLAALSGCTHTPIHQSSNQLDPINPDAPETPLLHAPSSLATPPPIAAEDEPSSHMHHTDHTDHMKDMHDMEDMEDTPSSHHTPGAQKGRPQ